MIDFKAAIVLCGNMLMRTRTVFYKDQKQINALPSLEQNTVGTYIKQIKK